MSIKKIIPIVIIIGIAALVLAGVGIAQDLREGDSSEFNIFKSRTKNAFNIDDKKDVSLDNIKELKIASISSDIKIYTHSENEAKAHFYGDVITFNQDSLPYLNVFKNGSTAVVEIKYPKVINNSISGKSYLDVYIPEEWSYDLKIDNISGKVEADLLSGRNIALNTISGKVDIKNISGKGELKLGSISGRYNIDFLESLYIDINTTSGNVAINKIKANELQASSISGKMDLIMADGKADISTTSGAINVIFKEGFKSFKASSISGRVNLVIPQNSHFDLNASSMSGRINANDFELKGTQTKKNSLSGTVGEGNNQVIINTTSGAILIEAGNN